MPLQFEKIGNVPLHWCTYLVTLGILTMIGYNAQKPIGLDRISLFAAPDWIAISFPM
jgi:hypothetical protein